MTDLAHRIRQLIDTYHSRNVSRAARETGIPRQTVVSLLAGGVASPHVGTLTALARTYHVPVGWILTGEGVGPDFASIQLLPHVEIAEWEQLVDSFDLPHHVRYVWKGLPRALGQARTTMHVGDSLNPQKNAADAERWRGVVEAEALALQGYIRLLKWAVEVEGRARVRRLLIKHAKDARVGFAWFPMVVRLEGSTAARAFEDAMDALATKHGIGEGQEPSTPVVEKKPARSGGKSKRATHRKKK